MYGKRKKQLVLALTAGLLLLLLCGCGAEKKTDAPSYTSLAELEDRRIGVTTGSVQATQVEERFPNARLYYLWIPKSFCSMSLPALWTLPCSERYRRSFGIWPEPEKP